MSETHGGKGRFEPEMPQPVQGFPDFGQIPLAGVSNARDLGGLMTADGRRVRRHRLLRSADLNGATALDVKMLCEDYELRHIFDLRTKVEIRNAEDPILRMPGVSYQFIPALGRDEVAVPDPDDIPADLHALGGFMADAPDYMKGLYRECLLGDDGQRAYKRLLHDLLDAPEGATLWHCTQGKDRTGLAAMLVEHALGVSERDILQDYLATNLFMDGWLSRLQQFLESLHVARALDVDLEAYVYAFRENLDAALGAVRDEYGTLDAYLDQALGFGEPEKVELRSLYLE